jgi:hypothetical protein
LAGKLFDKPIIIEIKDYLDHDLNALIHEFLIVLITQRFAQCAVYQITRRSHTLIEPEIVVARDWYSHLCLIRIASI